MEVIRRFCVGGKFFVRGEGEGEKGDGVMGWAVGFVIEYCGKGEGVMGWAVGIVIEYCGLFPKFSEYLGCFFEFVVWGR
jgi:hypothetical protein